MKIIQSREEIKGLTNTKLGMRKQEKVRIDIATINDDVRENMHLLEECRIYWDALRDFRTKRARNRKYYRGDQWSDQIEDPDNPGEYITEEQYLQNQGKVPLKQNLIGKTIRNLVGQYLSNPSKTVVLARARENAQVTEMLTNALQAGLQNNNAKLLDISTFREGTFSGTHLQKIGYKWFKDRNLTDVFIENINAARIFFNTDLSDIRLYDLRLIGEIRDTTVDELVGIFAKNEVDEEKIRRLYDGLIDKSFLAENGLDTSRIDNLDFYNCRDLNKARVYEVWQLKGEWRVFAHDPIDGTDKPVPYTLKEIAAQNEERLRLGLEDGMPEEEIPLIEAERKYEQFWYVKFLTPTGHCLYQGETPYKHEEHPYVASLQPFVDGEVWGIIEDMIDQQRYINRLIIQQDMIISSSAKGVLMVPEDAIPDNMTPDDFAKEWTRINGVIVYKPSLNHNRVPEQISAKSTNVGIYELLATQMNLLQDTSGIHGAIQGKEPLSGTPASLYAQQAQNATINTLEYMSYFENFLQKRDTKVLKVISQFYDEERYLAVNGRSASDAAKIWKPEMAQNIDFDLVVTQGTDTPVYRQLIDNTLMELLKTQLIDLEMFLEHTSLPFADKLLQSVRNKMQMLQQGQMPDMSMPPDVMAQVQAQADPKAMAMIGQVIGKKAA